MYSPLAMLPQLMAQEAGLHVDMVGFQAAMEEAKELSRAGEHLIPCLLVLPFNLCP